MEALNVMNYSWIWPLQDRIDFELICMNTISGGNKTKKRNDISNEGALLLIDI